jgi:hypothetical protein
MVLFGPFPWFINWSIKTADKFSDGSALVVWVLPALDTVCRVSLEAEIHFTGAASACVLP